MHNTSNRGSNEDDPLPTPTSAELDRWMSLIHSISPVRPEKLRESRAAIQCHRYDTESVIEATAERIWSELVEVGCEARQADSGKRRS